MAKKILLTEDITDAGKEYLRERGYELALASGIDLETLCREVVGCDGLLVRIAKCPRELFQTADRLKVIGKHGVGVDNIDLQAARDFGVTVTFAPTSNSNSVAEQAILFLLECARNSYKVCKAFRQNQDFSIRNRVRSIELQGKVLGIVGLGRIGRLVAQKAALGLGMKVLAYDLYPPREVPGYIEVQKDLQSVLSQADFVTLHVPATPQTRHIIQEESLGWMKPTAWLINTARGELIDDEALLKALQSGQIAGAAVDAHAMEPPAKDSLLLQQENYIATPHNAALTQEAMDRMGLHAAMGIDDVLSGREPQWPIQLG